MSRDYHHEGRPLSSLLSRIILTAEEDNRHILRVADFKDFYQTSDSNARNMISQLVAKGWLVRIGRGCYQLRCHQTRLSIERQIAPSLHPGRPRGKYAGRRSAGAGGRFAR